MAVDQGLRQTGIGTAQADAIIFIEAALGGTGGADGDARHALQRISHILVRHLADIFGRDHIDM